MAAPFFSGVTGYNREDEYARLTRSEPKRMGKEKNAVAIIIEYDIPVQRH